MTIITINSRVSRQKQCSMTTINQISKIKEGDKMTILEEVSAQVNIQMEKITQYRDFLMNCIAQIILYSSLEVMKITQIAIQIISTIIIIETNSNPQCLIWVVVCHMITQVKEAMLISHTAKVMNRIIALDSNRINKITKDSKWRLNLDKGKMKTEITHHSIISSNIMISTKINHNSDNWVKKLIITIIIIMVSS